MNSTHDFVNLNAEALPRCFVLDQEHNIVMSCSAQSGRPLEPTFFEAAASPALPVVLDRAVRVLRDRCVNERTTTKTATLGSYSIKVQLLQGRNRHTAVILDRAA